METIEVLMVAFFSTNTIAWLYVGVYKDHSMRRMNKERELLTLRVAAQENRILNLINKCETYQDELSLRGD